jgi:alpha-1,3-rhamnosyl/mannosyltransferase
VQTISRFSKSEIADVYGYDEERIFIAPPAAAGIFRPLGVRSTAIGIDQYGVSPGRFLLSVGTLEPRKNLRTLILAYSKIPKSVRDRTPLVVVGGKGWGELDLPPCTNSMQEEGNLRFFGSVSNPQLRHLYEGAIALLYPSVYEGFGMPVVEAMACGTMVIHSKRTAMDEITEGLAVTVEAMDVESWSQAIKDIIEHSALAGEECSERLVARAAQFNWASSAALIRQNYHAAIA